MRTRAGAERENDIRQFLVRPHLVGRRAGHVEDLAAQRQDRLRLAVARLLCRAARAVALDEKDLGAGGALARAVRELARKPQLARRALACEFALLPAPLPVVGTLGDPVEEHPRGCRVCAQPMVEMVLDSAFDELGCLGGGQSLLCLA